METIAWISVYIVGYVVSYLWFRYLNRDRWTVRLRTIWSMVSLLSWLSVCLMLFFSVGELITDSLKNESKAKW